jgi:hypothetical protein
LVVDTVCVTVDKNSPLGFAKIFNDGKLLKGAQLIGAAQHERVARHRSVLVLKTIEWPFAIVENFSRAVGFGINFRPCWIRCTRVDLSGLGWC